MRKAALAKAKNRFISKVRKTDSCWIWDASNDGTVGYGKFCLLGKMEQAHRISYEIYVGPIPSGTLVLHKCDNPPCVNPEHLFLGSHSDNMIDMRDKGRNPTSKLNPKKVSQIRAASGTQENIAKRFCITQPTVSMILSGKIWREVNGGMGDEQ